MLLLFPLLGGITPIRDDWNFCLDLVGGASLPVVLVRQLKGDFFRPIDIVAGALVDPRTLDGRVSFLVLALGFLLFLFVVRAAIGRLVRRAPLPVNATALFWLVVLWIVIQSAAAVSLWQLDTGSQVWSAAVGVAFGLALWSWVERAGRGEPVTARAAGLLALQVLGLLTKEFFLGWSASFALALLVLAFRARRKGNRRSARSFTLLAAAIGIVAIGYVLLRKELGGLTFGYGKYSGNVIVNSAKNVLLTLIGGLTVGPVHALRDPRALPIVRPLVLAGLAAAAVLAAAGVTALYRIERVRPGSGWLAGFVALVAIGSISAVLPTEHISEVNLLGPNAAIGLVVALGAVELLRARRALASIVITAVLAVGAFGTFGRLQHFAATWHDARAIEDEARGAIGSLPATDRTVFVVPSGVLVEPGFVHSTYVMPPGETLPPAALETWLARVFPGRKIRVGSPPPGESGTIVHLTGRGIAARPRD